MHVLSITFCLFPRPQNSIAVSEDTRYTHNVINPPITLHIRENMLLTHPQPSTFEGSQSDQHLERRPRNSRLARFVADAPTTTMQRLKGLTTGGLPTFVDYGRSFDAGINIKEDNWVHQAKTAGIDVSVVGDDTVTSTPLTRLSLILPFGGQPLAHAFTSPVPLATPLALCC